MYTIEFSSQAKKELKSLPYEVQDRIHEALNELKVNPYHKGVVKLTSSSKSNEYRLRVGDYRVIFSVFNRELVILVLRVRNRKNAYK